MTSSEHYIFNEHLNKGFAKTHNSQHNRSTKYNHKTKNIKNALDIIEAFTVLHPTEVSGMMEILKEEQKNQNLLSLKMVKMQSICTISGQLLASVVLLVLAYIIGGLESEKQFYLMAMAMGFYIISMFACMSSLLRRFNHTKQDRT